MFSLYEGLPLFDQSLHGIHVFLCAFAVVLAAIPLLTPMGSEEHKFGGMLYVPVSCAAFTLACVMAFREQSLALFCFNAFFAYLLLSGWRAMSEKNMPALIDWLIPGGLFLLSAFMALHAVIYDEGKQNLYLLFFAFNGFYLSWRDFKHLKRQLYWNQHKKFLVDLHLRAGQAGEWLNRHVAGMVGSVMANLSVVVLTLLPIELHWLWPATLIGLAAIIAWRQHHKKRQVRLVLAPVLAAKSRSRKPVRQTDDEDFRRAA